MAALPDWTACSQRETRHLPVNQGGPAAEQADAVAEVIAASVGVDIDPQPFRPILRGLLLTGGPPSLPEGGHQRPLGRRLDGLG